MEIQENQDSATKNSSSKKVLTKIKATALKKVDLDTAKAILQIKEKINKKSFGRKVKDGEIIALAIKQLTPEHLKELQEATYSEKDRLHLAHEDFQKINGKISLDQFIGKLIRGEVHKN